MLFYVRYVDLPDLGMCGRGRSFYTGAAIHTKPEVQSNIIIRYVALEWLTDAVQADLLGIIFASDRCRIGVLLVQVGSEQITPNRL